MQELQNGLKSISDQEGREQSIPVDIQTTPSNTPQWLQMLLDMVDYFQSKNIFTTTTPTTTSTTTAAPTTPATPRYVCQAVLIIIHLLYIGHGRSNFN